MAQPCLYFPEWCPEYAWLSSWTRYDVMSVNQKAETAFLSMIDKKALVKCNRPCRAGSQLSKFIYMPAVIYAIRYIHIAI